MPPFAVNTAENESYKFVPKKRRLGVHRELTDKQLVTCCHKLLVKLPNEFSAKWDWSLFIQRFSNSIDVEIRWFVFIRFGLLIIIV